jgi:hypothetical protein
MELSISQTEECLPQSLITIFVSLRIQARQEMILKEVGVSLTVTLCFRLKVQI